MREIVGAVEKSAHLRGEIALSSQEQSAGIELINRAVADIDTNTQQNAMMVEQAANAANSLHEQTVRLEQAISLFKLNRMESSSDALAKKSPRRHTHQLRLLQSRPKPQYILPLRQHVG